MNHFGTKFHCEALYSPTFLNHELNDGSSIVADRNGREVDVFLGLHSEIKLSDPSTRQHWEHV